jgi:fatty-acid desaturase
VNRHRLHHTYADHEGDPNKLAADGFWKTLRLCLFPYPTTTNVANDAILKTWPFRLVSHPLFVVASPVLSCGLLWLVVRDLKFAIGVWLGVRVFALWVNMVQNYWTHDRRWGTRRYHDKDNAMNIGDWLPVMATFSACWQNNHHHYAHLLRLTHAPGEFDFGYMTVRVMKSLGLVDASKTGTNKPDDVPLAEVTL